MSMNYALNNYLSGGDEGGRGGWPAHLQKGTVYEDVKGREAQGLLPKPDACGDSDSAHTSDWVHASHWKRQPDRSCELTSLGTDSWET